MIHASLCRLLGGRLRGLRESRGKVLKEIEQQSGISAAHVSEIERGKTSPTISVLERLAKCLGVSTSYLLDLPPIDRLRVVSPPERRVLRDDQQNSQVERLSETWSGGELVLHRVRLEPGAIFAGENPPSEDIIFVLRGSVGVRIGQDWEYLGDGDVLHLKTREPLRVTNSGPDQAEIFWAMNLACHL